MYLRLPAVGLSLTALAFVCSAGSEPAVARRAVPDVRGTYFGNFRNTRGDLRQCDALIASQNGRWVGGLFNIAAIPQGSGMTGKLSGSDRITLTAQTSQGRAKVRVRMNARYEAQPDLNRLTLMGTYVMTGGIKERGTFELYGSNNAP